MFPSLCPSQALAPLPDLGDKQSSPVFQKTVAAQVQVDLAPGRSGFWESLLLGKEPLRHPSRSFPFRAPVSSLLPPSTNSCHGTPASWPLTLGPESADGVKSLASEAPH